MIYVSETLTVALECVKDLKQQQRDFMAAHSQNNSSWNQTQSPFQFPLRMLQGLLSQSESNKARVQNEITLVCYKWRTYSKYLDTEVVGQCSLMDVSSVLQAR